LPFVDVPASNFRAFQPLVIVIELASAVEDGDGGDDRDKFLHQTGTAFPAQNSGYWNHPNSRRSSKLWDNDVDDNNVGDVSEDDGSDLQERELSLL